MTLRVLIPEKVILERQVRKVIAEGEQGSFGLLPRHVDFVAPLVPGILAFEADEEAFMAVDEGVLVKCGREVLVSVRDAVLGPELGVLEATVRNRFQRVTERERDMRSALAKLESEVVRRFLEIGAGDRLR